MKEATMKAVKAFLKNFMIVQERSGMIRQIMDQYQEDDFEMKVDIKTIDSLIEHLSVIIKAEKEMHKGEATDRLIKDTVAKDCLTELRRQKAQQSKEEVNHVKK